MSDLQRDKFEVWFKSKWRKHALTLNYDLTYVDDVVQDAWVIWQAAIESVVIELPPEHEVAHGYDAGEILYAIKSAGVKHK